jgi:hypothetical protein
MMEFDIIIHYFEWRHDEQYWRPWNLMHFNNIFVVLFLTCFELYFSLKIVYIRPCLHCIVIVPLR